MDTIQRVGKTDLARHTKEILRAVQRGQMAIVEGHGRAEVAILDVVDYWLMRAVMVYYAHPTPPPPTITGLTTDMVDAIEETQERYNLVMAHYLAEAISLGRAAELLGLTWLDLRMRAVKLAIPQRHLTEEDVTADLNNALTWAVDE